MAIKIKLVLLGPAATGKTSLIWRFIKSKFNADYRLTFGCEVITKDVEYEPGEIATVEMWDIGGQMYFEFIRDKLYKDADGALLVFDLTRADTYDQVTTKWLQEVRQCAGENIPFVLIGNKIDLIKELGEVVNRLDAKQFAVSQKSTYIETSSLDGTSVDEVFLEITRRVIANLPKAPKISRDVTGKYNISDLTTVPECPKEAPLFQVVVILTIIIRLYGAKNDSLLDTLWSAMKFALKKCVESVKVVSTEEDLNRLKRILRICAANSRLKDQFDEIKGYSHCLLALSQSNTDWKKAGWDFFEAVKVLSETNPLLSVKLFFVATGILSLTDYGFINSEVMQGKISVLAKQIDEVKSPIASTVHKFFEMGLSFLDALDPINYLPHALVSIENFLKAPPDSLDPLTKSLFNISQKIYDEIQASPRPPRIVSMTITPSPLIHDKPILCNVSIFNQNNKSTRVLCRINAPGTEAKREEELINLAPHVASNIAVVLGIPKRPGYFLFQVGLLDTDRQLLSTREYPLYVLHPEEYLHLGDIKQVTSSGKEDREEEDQEETKIKEGKQIGIQVAIINGGRQSQNCELKVLTNRFDAEPTTPAFVVPGGEIQVVNITLKNARQIGNCQVEFQLIRRESGKICDWKAFEVIIKRSYLELIKTTLVAGLKGLSSVSKF